MERNHTAGFVPSSSWGVESSLTTTRQLVLYHPHHREGSQQGSQPFRWFCTMFIMGSRIIMDSFVPHHHGEGSQHGSYSYSWFCTIFIMGRGISMDQNHTDGFVPCSSWITIINSWFWTIFIMGKGVSIEHHNHTDSFVHSPLLAG